MNQQSKKEAFILHERENKRKEKKNVTIPAQ